MIWLHKNNCLDEFAFLKFDIGSNIKSQKAQKVPDVLKAIIRAYYMITLIFTYKVDVKDV